MLMKKLIINAGVILGILAAGVFMEIHQEGEGVLKLTILCVTGLGLYFLYLCQVIFQKKYETLVINWRELGLAATCTDMYTV